MPITFRNAPLIEVIAELKWGFGAMQQMPIPMPGGQPFAFNLETVDTEAFFSRFGEEIAARGIPRAERMMPPGFPVFPGQVVYRYKSASKSSANLLQIGPGVFTANALPPYKSWENFELFIGEGIDALLDSRPASERDSEFVSVNLRFVNGFGREYLYNTSKVSFLRKLGFGVNTPSALDQITKEIDDTNFNLNFSSTLADGSIVQVNVGEGLKDGAAVQIVELGCTHTGIEPTREKLLSALNDSHSLIESIFLDMTKNIRDIMIPQEVNNA